MEYRIDEARWRVVLPVASFYLVHEEGSGGIWALFASDLQVVEDI